MAWQAHATEPLEALNVFKTLEQDDLVFAGFLASRAVQSSSTVPQSSLFAPQLSAGTGASGSSTSEETADYRVFLGMHYRRNLSETAQLSAHTFYGAGSYDGASPTTGSAPPEEVRATGSPLGEWLGTEWQVNSRLFDRYSVQAAVEYRQQLATELFQDPVFARPGAQNATDLQRKVGFVTRSELAIAPDLSLSTALRYEEHPEQPAGTFDPRVELLYRPQEDATVRALFDQSAHAPLSRERACLPLLNNAQQSDRVRNYELAYEQSLTERERLRVSAYRYDADGLLTPTSGAAATGFEVGMERKTGRGARAGISYAWQQTTDLAAGANQSSLARHLTKLSVGVPILANRFSTGFELQYHDVISPLIRQRNTDFLIGNLTLASGELTPSTHLSLGMKNVFDVRDPVSGSLALPFAPTDGRSVRMDVTYKPGKLIR